MTTTINNPKSDLVFDFPDPIPRFEFDDSPTRSSCGSAGSSSSRGRGGGGGSGVKYSSPVKTGGKSRRFGKFGKHKPKAGAAVSSGSSSLDECGGTTATTASLNASYDSSWSSGDEGSSPTRKMKKNNSNLNGGDIAAGPHNHFTFDDSLPSPATKLNLLQPHALSLSSSRRSATSNTSESGISEFSFDRVTVTTNETGLSSNVSWSFFDDTVMQAAGAGQRGDGLIAGGATTGSSPSPISSSTGSGGGGFSGGVSNNSVGNGRINNSNGKKKVVQQQMQMQQHRQQNINSTSTFDSSDADYNMGMTNLLHSAQPCDQSVISEISERTGGDRGIRSGSGMDDEALLLKGMKSAQLRHHYLASSEYNKMNSNNNNSKSARFKLARAVVTSGSGEGDSGFIATSTTIPVTTTNGNTTIITESYSRDAAAGAGTTTSSSNHVAAIKSSSISKHDDITDDHDDNRINATDKGSRSSKSNNNFINDFFEDVQLSYNKFKASRTSTPTMNNNNKSSPSAAATSSTSSPSPTATTAATTATTILHSLMEDLQFCGLYLCGNLHDTTTGDDCCPSRNHANGGGGGGVAHSSSYEEVRMKKKEDRKKEADMTFVGKVIECGTETRCGEGLLCAAF